MKKLVLSLAIIGFMAFGVISIQNLIASPSNIEMVNFDKDPKKDGDKKTAETKEVKATEAKANETGEKAGSSDCSDKSASSKSCSDKDRAGCCPSSPDKK